MLEKIITKEKKEGKWMRIFEERKEREKRTKKKEKFVNMTQLERNKSAKKQYKN